MKGSELDNCDDKTFPIHKLWLLSVEGGVSGRHQKGVLTAPNWWSVEYETAASGTTQQYKGKMRRSCKSRVVVVQWLEHWWLKPMVRTPATIKNFSHLSFAFFPGPFR